MMASKRKREDDFEYAPSSAKMSKNEDSSSVSRSGRARKKPARFLDQDEGDEGSPETQEVETKPVPVEIQVLKSSPNLLTAPPQIISSTPQLIMAAPQIISADSQLISNPTQLISVAPQSVNTAPQLISSIPQLISSAPQLITSISQLINTSPQLIASSPQVISGTPQMIVSPESIIQPKIESSDTPKQSRVRKKSAKVIEMEEFEKAEKVKSTKKTPKVGSPEFSTLTASTAAGGIQPQILQAANIQLNLMNALNTSTSTDVQSSLLAHLRKNPQLVRVVDDQKLGSIKTEPMLVSGPFVSPGEAVMGDQIGSVKDEPIDTVDPNILLPQAAPGSALLTHLTKMAQQEGNVSPTKSPPKKKTPKAKTVKEEPVTSMAGDSQSKSVIKMLLNKPAQFSEPVISTQTLSQINSPVSDKNVKKPVRLKLSTESTPVSQIGPAGDASYGHATPTAITGSMDTGRPSTSSVGMDIKKKIKKTKRKQSVSILDEEDDDDEEYDEEEDDDDDDLMEDDLDDNDDEMDWEFETQDGNLIIADETPKKSTKKTPPSKKKGKKDENQSNSGAGKEKKGPKEKKRKRLTAYTMWCNSVRYKVLNENPGIDFAQLSRRLGEIWQSVPAKDKMAWKRKAKREARKLLGKGLLITTGKGGGSSQSQTSVSGAQAVPSSSTTPPPIYHPPIRHHSGKHHSSNNSTANVSAAKLQEDQSGSPSKMLGIDPIDTAAHLKLVGDSLSIIGIRLQEHRGLIAVQGSLSVLLDSLLCAVGPLMCLTTQVPELNGCSAKTHTRVLDNIAYIMPGL
uniref:HMG box domain-containing protein n=4 Tax=Magallana gigas TaxID=29159 RepID=A0A8W8NAJ8_MAGGI|nr:HMG box-containing protein 4 isoform X2 [Crassostrea gigas]